MSIPSPTALYKDLYDAEWARREQIQSATALPVGLLTILGGGLIVFVQRYDGTPAGLLSALFWCSIALAVGSYGVAVVQIVRSIRGFVYQRIPWPSQIHAYYDDLVQYCRATGGAVEGADQEFESFLEQRYIEATDRNSLNNVERGALLYSANQWIVITLVLMGIAALPFTIAERGRPQTVHKVEVLSPGAPK